MKQRIAAQPPRIEDVRIEGGFWGFWRRLVRESVIPYQWEALNDRIPGAAPSHCIENFRLAAEKNRGGAVPPAAFYGWVFQDSDLAKWLEAAAYVLAAGPDPELERLVDEAVSLIAAAQEPDGYLDTCYTIAHADEKWTNLRDDHELYCAGHMIEAAVALFESTGKRGLLDVMERNVAHIRSVLGAEAGKKRGYPGHPEIELALVRMYRATGNAEHLALAEYFIRERGREPLYFAHEPARAKEGPRHWTQEVIRPELAYYMADKPILGQETVRGHAVRALYLLSGIIDVAAETGAADLMSAARRLWDDCVGTQMYVTGGVGSTHHGEAFTFAHDLPNDTAYAETCASIALIFAAQRLLRIEPDARIADTLERALYNTCIGSMQLDGTRFLYVNPLEVWPEACEKDCDHWHVTPERQKWFGCACCPPNLARLIASLAQYAYGIAGDRIHAHLYVDSEASFETSAGTVGWTLRTAYPKDGRIRIETTGAACTAMLRIPGWCAGWRLRVNGVECAPALENGYLPVPLPEGGATVELELEMTARRIRCSTRVPENAGRVALQRGPIVYCAEQADNGERLWELSLPKAAPVSERFEPELLGGVCVLTAEGRRTSAVPAPEHGLYALDGEPSIGLVPITFIPYYSWSNRGVGEMRVWLREEG